MGPSLSDRNLLSRPEVVALLEDILETSTECSIVGVAPDGTIQLWNEGARRLYGYTVEEVAGKAKFSILNSAADVALEQGSWQGSVASVRKDGARFTASVVLTARRDEMGRHIGFLLVSKDISEQVRLATAEQEFRGLLESAPDAMAVVNRQRCLALGAVQCLFRPIEPAVLLAEIAIYLNEGDA
jgi:PAS domain S-box-containing protein